MSSWLELACGRERSVDPDVDSKMGAETRMRRGDWQRGGGGGGDIWPRDEVGVGGGWTTSGEDVWVEMGIVILKFSVRGSVWMETEA